MSQHKKVGAINLAIELLEKHGYINLSAQQQHELTSEEPSSVILTSHLQSAIDKLNSSSPAGLRKDAFTNVLDMARQNLMEANEAFHKILNQGISVSYQDEGAERGGSINLIDFYNPRRNYLSICSNLTIKKGNLLYKPDLVIMINGLPLVVMEFGDPRARLVDKFGNSAYSWGGSSANFTPNLAIAPSLFCYNCFSVISDHEQTLFSSVFTDARHPMIWKSPAGESKSAEQQLTTLINEMFHPEVLLDYIRNFIVFCNKQVYSNKSQMMTNILVKDIGTYHQYYGVNRAIASTINAADIAMDEVDKSYYGLSEINLGSYAPPVGAKSNKRKYSPKVNIQEVQQSKHSGNKKGGILCHTYGTDNALTMLFYAGKIIRNSPAQNPTLVFISDRNDMDEQIFQTFVAGKQLLHQAPIQADSHSSLKKLLSTSGGRVIFTTIQKFYSGKGATSKVLSDRNNIFVIVNGIHLSHYGFGNANTKDKNVKVFANYLKDNFLPNATVLGFGYTPNAPHDTSADTLFGDYIDIYDIKQALNDKSIVKVYYEKRLTETHIAPEDRVKEDISEVDFSGKNPNTVSWQKMEKFLARPNRLKLIAQDIVNHFEQHSSVLQGKAIIATMSRRIAVDLYEQIIKLRPQWQDDNILKGKIKVLMAPSTEELTSWEKHQTTQKERKILGARFKDPNDPLRLVIVRDMWLTGFDAACLDVLYWDKPLQGRQLMQAISIVNNARINKPGGLIVDYMGISDYLSEMTNNYVKRGGDGAPIQDMQEAITTMEQQHKKMLGFFCDFNYEPYSQANRKQRLAIIRRAQEYVLYFSIDKFTRLLSNLSLSHSMVISTKSAVNKNLEFFHTLRKSLALLEINNESSNELLYMADDSIVKDSLAEFYDKDKEVHLQPQFLTDELLARIHEMDCPNLELRILAKLIHLIIINVGKNNFVTGDKFASNLFAILNKSAKRSSDKDKLISSLMELALELRDWEKERNKLGLSEEVYAIYSILIDHQSNHQKDEGKLKSDKIIKLAKVILNDLRSNATIDWNIREKSRAKLRIIVKYNLRKVEYLASNEKDITDSIISQIEIFIINANQSLN